MAFSNRPDLYGRPDFRAVGPPINTFDDVYGAGGGGGGFARPDAGAGSSTPPAPILGNQVVWDFDGRPRPHQWEAHGASALQGPPPPDVDPALHDAEVARLRREQAALDAAQRAPVDPLTGEPAGPPPPDVTIDAESPALAEEAVAEDAAATEDVEYSPVTGMPRSAWSIAMRDARAAGEGPIPPFRQYPNAGLFTRYMDVAAPITPEPEGIDRANALLAQESPESRNLGADRVSVGSQGAPRRRGGGRRGPDEDSAVAQMGSRLRERAGRSMGAREEEDDESGSRKRKRSSKTSKKRTKGGR